MSVMSASQIGNWPAAAAKLRATRATRPLPAYVSSERVAFQKTSKEYDEVIILVRSARSFGSPLPRSMVEFQSGREVVIGKYSANAGDATLMLIEIPTPQSCLGTTTAD